MKNLIKHPLDHAQEKNLYTALLVTILKQPSFSRGEKVPVRWAFSLLFDLTFSGIISLSEDSSYKLFVVITVNHTFYQKL